MYCASRLRTVI